MAANNAPASTIAGKGGGSLVTKDDKNKDLTVQFSEFVRAFYESMDSIRSATAQMGRVCGDQNGKFTCFTQDYMKDNMTLQQQKLCEEINDLPGIYFRKCYICGEKIYGKENLKRAYIEQNITDMKFHSDARSSEVEHVADMSMATPFGILAEDPRDIKDYHRGEYLWAHNRCNKCKNDRSLLYIDQEEKEFKTDILLCLKLQFKILRWLNSKGQREWAKRLEGWMGNTCIGIYNKTGYETRDATNDDIQNEINTFRDSINQENNLVIYMNEFVNSLNTNIDFREVYPNGVISSATFDFEKMELVGGSLEELKEKFVQWSIESRSGIAKEKKERVTLLKQIYEFAKNPPQTIEKIADGDKYRIFEKGATITSGTRINPINNKKSPVILSIAAKKELLMESGVKGSILMAIAERMSQMEPTKEPAPWFKSIAKTLSDYENEETTIGPELSEQIQTIISQQITESLENDGPNLEPSISIGNLQAVTRAVSDARGGRRAPLRSLPSVIE